MTTRAAGRIWGVHADTVRRWCEQGRIAGARRLRDGGHWRVPVDAALPNGALSPLLSVSEVARLLGRSVDQVRSMCERGVFKGAHQGTVPCGPYLDRGGERGIAAAATRDFDKAARSVVAGANATIAPFAELARSFTKRGARVPLMQRTSTMIRRYKQALIEERLDELELEIIEPARAAMAALRDRRSAPGRHWRIPKAAVDGFRPQVMRRKSALVAPGAGR